MAYLKELSVGLTTKAGEEAWGNLGRFRKHWEEDQRETRESTKSHKRRHSQKTSQRAISFFQNLFN